MKMVSIMAFNYNELSDKAKRKVEIWLDEVPFDYETENEEGKLVTEYDYFSEWSEELKTEHCEINGYLFDKNGRYIHNLIEG